jgi:AhpD family alkylhydroperoxidase
MRIQVSKAQILSAFNAVSNQEVFAQSAARVHQGELPLEMIQAMCANPMALSGFAAFSAAIYPGGSLERDIQELVILAASVRNACQFCAASHQDIARSVGLCDDPVSLLDSPESMSDRQRLAVEWTRSVLQDSNAISDAQFDEVRACFGDAGLVELTLLVGYINMLNLFNNALENRYNGELAARPGDDPTP